MVKIKKTEEFINENKRIVVTVIYDEMNNRFVGKAYCSIDDGFDKDFGSKLSYLRAKRLMLRAYDKENKNYYNQQKKNWEDFCKRAEKEFAKYKNALEKTEAAIDDLLAE